MKTLIAAVAFATVFAAPVFAESVNAWGWKGALAAPASAKSAYAVRSTIAAALCRIAAALCRGGPLLATVMFLRRAHSTGPTATDR